MTDARQKAIDKQRAAGNSPEDTRCSSEVDHGYTPWLYQTGRAYRVLLESRLKRRLLRTAK